MIYKRFTHLILVLAALLLLSNCSLMAKIWKEIKGRNTEFEPKPISFYQEQGAIFSNSTTFKEYEDSYIKKQNEGLLTCKKFVKTAEREEKLGHPHKEACELLHHGKKVNGNECCEALYQNKFLTQAAWIKFKSSFQKGDVLYYIGKKSVKGHGGYSGLAIVRNGMVVNIYHSVVS